jgi:hypothetical protein
MLFHEFAGGLYIFCQQLGYIPVHGRPDHDSETGNFLGIGRHRVRCQNPVALADFSRNIKLVVPGHGLVQRQCHHWNTLGLVHDLELTCFDQAITQILGMLQVNSKLIIAFPSPNLTIDRQNVRSQSYFRD